MPVTYLRRTCTGTAAGTASVCGESVARVCCSATTSIFPAASTD